jgi:2-C-methyl-D-erythritol 4-phosphate cytidylyltransferase/2-C-methyl-D-erythritol 2,4-cyclodiphosphate synthase
VVPAAGRGARFDSAQVNGPKQYAPLVGATVLEWSLHSLLLEPRVEGIVVALAADDSRWPRIAAAMDGTKLRTTLGAATRQESVLNGLRALAERAAPDDWVLVHDAARPCLTARDLAALIDTVQGAHAAPGRGAVHDTGAVHDYGSVNDAGSVHNAGAGDAGAVHDSGSVNDAGSVHNAGVANAGAVRAAAEVQGALLAAPVVDTVKREQAGLAADTVDREGLWRALTPQVFRYAALKDALAEAVSLGLAVTDEAQAMERVGIRAALVRGSPFNIKVTRPEDLSMAETILKGTQATEHSTAAASAAYPGAVGAVGAVGGVGAVGALRIGQGFDVHAFGDGDHVVLGGVTIDHTRGVVAHSDGDVVIHALCDAVLGALGQGDIGQHFPDTDPRYRGADSRVFLREVARLMRAANLRLVNADITVLAEAPRVARHRAAMAANLGEDLGVPSAQINIKATTTERLGFIGRTEGLAASATVLLAPAASS